MKARSNKCASCGKQHVPGFAFCQRCGVPLGAELGSGPLPSRHTGDGEEEDEATDLNGRMLNLLEQGKRKEAIRLYHEVLGGEIKVAEAAIDELAKNVEFEEIRHEVPPPGGEQGQGQTAGFNGWIAAIKSLLGFDRG